MQQISRRLKSSSLHVQTEVNAARSFPNGIPSELRSKLQAAGILVPAVTVSESDRLRMEMALGLAKIDI